MNNRTLLPVLSSNQRNFAENYLKSGDSTESYRRNYDCANFSESTIVRRGKAMLKNKNVADYINQINERASAPLIYGVQEVLRDLIDIATADPNELIQLRRECCRFCHGRAHHYQWRDAEEFAVACAMTIDYNGRVKLKAMHKRMPTDEGGYGYNQTKTPHSECPKCDGVGNPTVFAMDTRNLSPKARKLYAGVKQTKDGFQVLMRNQDHALELIAKCFGMLADKVEISGPGGGPVTQEVVTIPATPDEAARFYLEFVKRAANS